MRLEAKKKQPKRKQNKVLKGIKTFFWVLFLFIVISVAAVIGFGIGMYLEQASVVSNIGNIEPPEATVIYAYNKNDKKENVVLERIFKENRTNVDFNIIPQHLKDATIAVEDKRFYEHSGVDVVGVVRALFKNLSTQNLSQGASTITMQLARNLKLGFGQEKTVTRKIQELLVAFQIEREMSKDQILEAYLNRVYYGNGSFGVQAASKVYFNKNVEDLTLSQSAFIAGLPKAPSYYSENTEKAIKRRNVILDLMLSQGFINKTEYDKAINEKLVVLERKPRYRNEKYKHFISYVINELKKKFDEDEIYSGGLRVYTTLDTRIQDIADNSFHGQLDSAKKRTPKLESAFIAIQPDNGFIRAMIGSIDRTSEFNRAVQAKRQPGSVFKIVVYCAAMEKLNWTPYSRISNERYVSKDGRWKPKNYDGKYGGSVTIKTAVANSMNMAAIRAAEKTGMNNVVNMAKRMGIKTPIEPYLSSAIGGMSGITPMEMLLPYEIVANNGIFVEPTSINRVYDKNMKNCLIDNSKPSKPTRVLGDNVSKYMDEMLRAVVTSGTGRQVSSIKDARGKTGTNGYFDVWFAGYVPNKLAALVWIGNDNNTRIPSYYSGGGQCGPIWRDFMRGAIPILDGIVKETGLVKIDKSTLKSTVIKSEEIDSKEDDGRVKRRRKAPSAVIVDETTSGGEIKRRDSENETSDSSSSNSGSGETDSFTPTPPSTHTEPPAPSPSHDDVTAEL